MTRRFALMLMTVLACARPGTRLFAMMPQAEQAADYRPTDEQVAYGIMAASAMRQARFLTTDKSVGVYQPDDPRHPLHPIVKIVLDENRSFRPVKKGEVQVACSVPLRPGIRTVRVEERVCGLDQADVLYQVMAVQIMRDSGYVGGYITQIFKGEDRPRTTVFCFISVWRPQARAWEDVRNSLVKEPLDCSAGKKH